MAGGALLVGVSPSAVGTIAGAFLMGSGGTLMIVATQAGLADRHGPLFAAAFAEANAAASVCGILAAALVGLLAGAGLDPRLAPLLALPTLAVIAATLGRAPVGDGPRRAGSQRRGQSGRLPRAFWAFCLVLFLGVGVEWSVGYWGADFLAGDGVGLAPAEAATTMGVFFGAGAAGRLVASRLARRLAAPTLLIGALGLALVGFPLFWLGPSPALNVAGLVVVGLGVANVYPLAIAGATAVSPGLTELAAARMALGGGSAVLLAPLALGALADRVGIERALGAAVPLLLGGLAAAVSAQRLGGPTALGQKD